MAYYLSSSSFSLAARPDSPLPPLPPFDYSCYRVPIVPPGVTRRFVIDEPATVRNLETNDYDVQTVVRENNNHTYLNKTIVTQVNRNHLHTQRIITNENNYETYVTNHVIRVQDIHRQRVENVPGERRVFNSYQQAPARVEQARCLRVVDGALVPCSNRS